LKHGLQQQQLGCHIIHTLRQPDLTSTAAADGPSNQQQVRVNTLHIITSQHTHACNNVCSQQLR
jgi:hypothetical protein